MDSRRRFLPAEASDPACAPPARLRNRLVPGYWSIDIEILHATATEQLRSSSTTSAQYSPW
jgi:uncharacterized protein YutE (UPF0331/DUF86 family)